MQQKLKLMSAEYSRTIFHSDPTEIKAEHAENNVTDNTETVLGV